MVRRALVVLFVLAALSAAASAAPLGASDATSHFAQDPCEPRPITPLGENFFTDISIDSGLKPEEPPEGMRTHPRAAFADVDGDGFDDVITHSMSGGVANGTEQYEHLIYRNNGDGTFSDFGAESGLQDVQAALFAFGDVDNDGDQDCFAGIDIKHPDGPVTNQILLNDGEGHFTVLEDSGVEVGSPTAGERLFGVGAALFADFNNDGRLDLYVGNGNTGSTGYYMSDQYFVGNGDGTFVEQSDKLAGVDPSLSNGAMTADFDNDGDVDLFVSTYGVSGPDHSQKRLWINDGLGNFTEDGVTRGVASQPGGNTWRADLEYGKKPEPGAGPGDYIGANGFGVDATDINNDGLMDILMATISHPGEFPPGFRGWPQDQIDQMNYTRRWSDPSQILVNKGRGGGWSFANEWQDRKLPFNECDIDAASADFDNDGLMDITMSRDKKCTPSYSLPDQQGWLGLYHQMEDGLFESVGMTSGINHPDEEALQRMMGSGNINWSDIDHDGDLDLLLGGGPKTPTGHLFRNDIGSENDWLAVRLIGDGVKVNRDAVGARVTISDGEVTLTREVKTARGTYNSMDTRVLHFGLGDMKCGYRMTIRWPDGSQETKYGQLLGRNKYVDFRYTAPAPPIASDTPEATETPVVTPTPDSWDTFIPSVFKGFGW